MGGWIRKLAPVVVLVLLAAGVYVWRAPLLAWGSTAWASLTGSTPRQPASALLIASGVVEAQTVDVAAPVPGRIRALHLSDGQRVEAGQPVAELDAALLDAQIRAAAQPCRSPKPRPPRCGQVHAKPISR